MTKEEIQKIVIGNDYKLVEDYCIDNRKDAKQMAVDFAKGIS